MEPSPRRARDAWICALLIAATAAVYAPVRGFEFVNYDDPVYVTENPMVRAGLTAPGIAWALTGIHSATWHPLTSLSHMLDCQLFGLSAGAHHLMSAALHLAGALLLFAALRRMTGVEWQAGFVAALFALHPLHVESVAWVSERKDVLSTFFFMLTLYAYAGYVRAPSRRRYAAVAASCALGLLAKPMLVTLPAVLLLLDLWPLRRMVLPGRPAPPPRPCGPTAGTAVSVPVGRLLIEKTPLFGLALIVSAVTIYVQQRAGAVGSAAAYPIGSRVANALVAYAAYLTKTIWPANLAVFYPYREPLPLWEVAGAAALLLAVSAAVARAARRRPYLLVGWLWYVGTLLPVIGLIQVGEQAMADRYTYIPLVGIFIMVAWGAPDLLGGWRPRRAVLAAAAVAILAACGVATWRQVQPWHDSAALFRHALAATADNYVAHTNLGAVLVRQGDLEAAEAHFAEALRIKPEYARAHLNVGMMRVEMGDPDAALPHLAVAARLDPRDAMTQYNLGVASGARGDFDAAIAYYTRALDLQPDYAKAHNNLGVALAARSRFAEAVPHYRAALSLAPDLAPAHTNLGIALEHLGQPGEAVAHYREVVRLAPDQPLARLNLAAALLGLGRTDEATAILRDAAQQWPDRAEVRAALTEALATP